MLKQAIEVATDYMGRLYELSGGVKQDVEKGAFREFFVASLIRPLMPSHFGVGSGVVVAVNGQQSRQTDVIIYDRRLLPPILLAGERGVFPIDSVLAVVEVKSTLAASHYSGLVDAARRFVPPDIHVNGLPIAIPGRLAGDAARPMTIWPLFSVFAYTSDAPQKDELERLQEQAPDHNNSIRLIGVLDKGVWSFEKEQWLPFRSSVPGDNSVKFFFSLLNPLEDTAKSRGAYRLQDWLG
jgi:hypothetical protein